MARGRGSSRTDAEIRAEKQATLRKLAGKRIMKAVRAVRNVGKLGRYKPSEAQIKFTFDALAKSLTDAHNAWKGATEVKEETFVLPNA